MQLFFFQRYVSPFCPRGKSFRRRGVPPIPVARETVLHRRRRRPPPPRKERDGPFGNFTLLNIFTYFWKGGGGGGEGVVNWGRRGESVGGGREETGPVKCPPPSHACYRCNFSGVFFFFGLGCRWIWEKRREPKSSR